MSSAAQDDAHGVGEGTVKARRVTRISAIEVPRFRHDPLKNVLPLGTGMPASVRWDREPVVCGHAQLLHRNEAGTSIPVPVCASPVAVPGVGVMFGCYDGHVRLYNSTLTKVFWQIRLGGPIYASLVADRPRRRVVVATTSGEVTCVDLRGTVIWRTQTGASIHATPTLLPEADLLVLTAFDSRCLGIDLATGAVHFSRDLPRPWHTGTGSAAHRDPYASPATTVDGNAVVACAEHVLCLRPDGTEVWRYEADHTIKSSPVVLSGRDEVAVCSVDGRCLFLSTGSGALRGVAELGGKVVASPAVSGRFLVLGTQDGTAHGIDAERRAVVWSAQGYGPREYTSFTVLPDGNVAAVVPRGNTVGLRPQDGRFLWETSQVLGLADHDPAMDVTPVVGPDGSMYCGSYSGMLYHFRFRTAEMTKE
ncbi:PQQ-binding-like beta-propeller repeat protein [Streptomyces sp. JH010]|uniref:outer membrane protein assembly factor BamB family protein n=1 Tax=Streptomyces sp. JH010 TaxID=2763535 RepID=UPI0023F8BFE3|nr:PQQ-binding-like beta-propeller repeat protein [Streptomyces sp. JH010]MDF6066228.1 PQQ-binding-like beta-propeller repeat protein [Streptomyces sp. JH010]